MLLNNRIALLTLSFLFGAFISISNVGAQAFLLSQVDSAYLLAISVAFSLGYTVFLRAMRSATGKFAHVSTMVLVAYVVLQAATAAAAGVPSIRAVAWLFLAYLGTAITRWIVQELAERHLSYTIARTYTLYLVTAFDLGSVISLVGFTIVLPATPPGEMMLIVCAGLSAAVAFLHLQFGSVRNVELRATRRASRQRDSDPLLSQAALRFIRIDYVLLFIAGSFGLMQEYLTRIVIQQELGSFASMTQVVADIYIYVGIISIIVGAIAGRVVNRYRISPIRMIWAYVLAVAACVAVILVSTQVALVVAFEVVRRSLTYLFINGQQMLVAALAVEVRYTLQSPRQTVLYLLRTAAIAGMAVMVSDFPFVFQVHVYQATLVALAAAATVTLPILRRRYTRVLEEQVASDDDDAAVLAMHALSFERPAGFVRSMKEIIDTSAEVPRKKSAVLALSCTREPEALDAVRRAFNTDREELQLAVLESMHGMRSFFSTRFLLDVYLKKEKAITPRVYQRAAVIISSSLGKAAVPFLLDGLRHPNSEVIADTLEALEPFREPELIPEIVPLLESRSPRVRSNAIFALSRFPSQRPVCIEQIRMAFDDRDADLVASLLYVIGKFSEPSLIPLIERLFQTELPNEPRIEIGLAWAFTTLGDHRGLELFSDILQRPAPPDGIDEALHQFAQLEARTRFDVLEHVGRIAWKAPAVLTRILHRLQRSNLYLAEETQYLRILAKEESAVASRFGERTGAADRLRAGMKAPSFQAQTLDGRTVSLEDFRGRRVWLAFFRYAGCPLCNLYLFHVLRSYQRLRDCGTELIAVFESGPAHFPSQIGGVDVTTLPLISNSRKDLYRLYSLESRLSAAFDPRVALMWCQAIVSGFVQSWPDGDIGQIPAHFLIDEEGFLAKAFYGKTIGDHIPWEEVEAFAGIRTGLARQS
jgi:thioredoxin-dependent peroxiredoxin